MSQCEDDGCDCRSGAVEKVRAQFSELSEEDLVTLTNELMALGQEAFATLEVPDAYVKEEHISSITTAAIRMGVLSADVAAPYEDIWAEHVGTCSFCTAIQSHSFGEES